MHIEKRRYLPGYHVSRIKKNESGIASSDNNIGIRNELVKSQPVQFITEISHTSVTRVSVNQPPVALTSVSKPKRGLMKVKADKCDEIVLFNGQKILARVELIGEKEVRYKKCDDPKGLTYQIKVSQVSHINLGNGDVFQPKDRKPVNVDGITKGANTTFIMSIIGVSLAVVCLVFSFLIYPFPLLAFIIGILDFIYSIIVGAVTIKFHRNLGTLKTRLALWFAFLLTLVILIAAFVIMFI